MIYRVQVEIKGYVDRYVEGDNIAHAINRVMETIDLGDVEMFCEKCYPVESYARKVKGEN